MSRMGAAGDGNAENLGNQKTRQTKSNPIIQHPLHQSVRCKFNARNRHNRVAIIPHGQTTVRDEGIVLLYEGSISLFDLAEEVGHLVLVGREHVAHCVDRAAVFSHQGFKFTFCHGLSCLFLLIRRRSHRKTTHKVNYFTIPPRSAPIWNTPSKLLSLTR